MGDALDLFYALQPYFFAITHLISFVHAVIVAIGLVYDYTDFFERVDCCGA